MGTTSSLSSSVQPRFSGLKITLQRNKDGQINWDQTQLDLKEADMVDTWKRNVPFHSFRKEDVLGDDEIRLTIPSVNSWKPGFDLKVGTSALVGRLSRQLSYISRKRFEENASPHHMEEESNEKGTQTQDEAELFEAARQNELANTLRDELARVIRNDYGEIDFSKGNRVPYAINGSDGIWKTAEKIFKEHQGLFLEILDPETGGYADNSKSYNYQNHTFFTTA